MGGGDAGSVARLRRPPARARLLAAGAGCLAAAAGVYMVAVRTATGQAVENVAMDGPVTGAEVDAARVLGFVAVGMASRAAVLGFAWLTRRVRLAT